jgi:hypothetical protein
LGNGIDVCRHARQDEREVKTSIAAAPMRAHANSCRSTLMLRRKIIGRLLIAGSLQNPPIAPTRLVPAVRSSRRSTACDRSPGRK